MADTLYTHARNGYVHDWQGAGGPQADPDRLRERDRGPEVPPAQRYECVVIVDPRANAAGYGPTPDSARLDAFEVFRELKRLRLRAGLT